MGVRIPEHPRISFDELEFLQWLRRNVNLSNQRKFHILLSLSRLDQDQFEQIAESLRQDYRTTRRRLAGQPDDWRERQARAEQEWQQLSEQFDVLLQGCQRRQEAVAPATMRAEYLDGLADLEAFNAAFEEKIIQPLEVIERKPPLERYPRDFHRCLQACVIGQDEAVRRLATLLFEVKLRSLEPFPDPDRRPHVCLLVGPSGSGKTHLVRQAARLLGRPLVSANCPSLVGSGIVGTRPSDVLNQLYTQCARNMDRARAGVVFLDEVDKLFFHTAGDSGTHGRASSSTSCS